MSPILSVALALAMQAAQPPSEAAEATAPRDSVALDSLTLEQRTALRCGVGFAIVAQGQAEGDARAAAFPPLASRGREFFVRATARLMDETGGDRAAIGDLVSAQVAEFAARPSAVEEAMLACLLLLDASGL